jgi:chloramphenicol O-acetyltransferase type A
MHDIDTERWPRKPHYDLYGGLDYPHFNVCADVDITRLHDDTKSRDLSLFIAILYGVCRAANDIEEFRLRIRGERIVCHDAVHPSFTVLADDNLFAFCPVAYTRDRRVFFRRTERAMADAKANPSLADEPGRDDYLFISSLPWVRFTSISHPIHMHPVDSVPRMTWGKYQRENGRVVMPLSVQVHHGLADGYHVGRFYDRFQKIVGQPEKF